MLHSLAFILKSELLGGCHYGLCNLMELCSFISERRLVSPTRPGHLSASHGRFVIHTKKWMCPQVQPFTKITLLHPEVSSSVYFTGFGWKFEKKKSKCPLNKFIPHVWSHRNLT